MKLDQAKLLVADVVMEARTRVRLCPIELTPQRLIDKRVVVERDIENWRVGIKSLSPSLESANQNGVISHGSDFGNTLVTRPT